MINRSTRPGAPRSAATKLVERLHARLAADEVLEEVRCRRLVVVDEEGRERVVAGTLDSAAFVDVHNGLEGAERRTVAVYAYDETAGVTLDRSGDIVATFDVSDTRHGLELMDPNGLRPLVKLEADAGRRRGLLHLEAEGGGIASLRAHRDMATLVLNYGDPSGEGGCSNVTLWATQEEPVAPGAPGAFHALVAATVPGREQTLEVLDGKLPGPARASWWRRLARRTLGSAS